MRCFVTDIFAEAEGLQRRRALLDALEKQGRETPITGVGSAKYSTGQAIAKILTAMMAQKQGDQLTQDMSANQGQYNTQLSEGVGRYLDTYGGKPGGTLNDAQAEALMRQNVAPPPEDLAEPVKADPRKAVTEALASRLPELRAVGGGGMKELLADISRRASPATRTTRSMGSSSARMMTGR